MRILGIDPGSSVTGYGVVEHVGGRLQHLAHGTLRPPRNQELALRLAKVPSESVRLNKAITTYGLDAMGLRSALNMNGVLSAIVEAENDGPDVEHLDKAQAEGGVGSLDYEFHLDDGRQEVRVQAGPQPFWAWTPSGPGNFRVKAIVRDQSGRLVESGWSDPFVVTPALSRDSPIASTPRDWPGRRQPASQKHPPRGNDVRTLPI